MTCEQARDRLGEWLAGALDLAEIGEIRQHLAGCAACREERRAFEDLEYGLRALGGARASRFPRRLAYAAAALVLVACGAWLAFRGSGTSVAEIVGGALATEAGTLRAGEKVPAHLALVAVAESSLRVGTAARATLAPSARVVVDDGHALSLDQGHARFEVTPSRDGFEVRTPRGVVSVVGTEFEVSVEEPVMTNPKLLGGSAAVVTVAVIAGVVMFRSNAPDASGGGTRVEAGQQLKASAAGIEVAAPPAAGPSETEKSLRAEIETLRKQLESKQAEAESLSKRAAAAEAENSKLQAEHHRRMEVQSDKLAQVLTSIQGLKTKGIGAFLAPGALAQLVSEVKGLGDAGTDLVTGMLKDPDSNARFLAAKLLEDLSDPRAIPALQEAALGDSEQMVAHMASHALALMDSREAVGSLKELVEKSEREGVRVNSMYGLLKHDDPLGYELVGAYLKNESNSAQMRAALAPGVFILDNAKTLPLADICVETFHDSEALMSMAVDYFKKLNSPEARLRLKNMAADARFADKVRRAAEDALKN